MRWVSVIIGLLLCVISVSSSASVLSSALLNEAHVLVDIEPIQAKKIANTYLTQRELSNPKEKSPSAISREDADRTLRTPSGTVEAYKILARAEFAMGNNHAAIQQLKKAKELTEVYELPYLHVDVDILDIRLRWLGDHDSVTAKAKLDQLETRLIEAGKNLHLSDTMYYRMTMMRGEIAAFLGQNIEAEHYFEEAKSWVEQSRSDTAMIDYHLVVGEYFLRSQKYNHALSELLYGYWKAVEKNKGARLAKVNLLLARLFHERRVLDKAIEHLSQAADFYDNYPNSPVLASVLQHLGDIYFLQNKYNLALVHYFSVLDHPSTEKQIDKVIDIRLDLAATYLQLYNYVIGENYLNHAIELLEYVDLPELKMKSALLKSALALVQEDSENVIRYAHVALEMKRHQRVDDIYTKQEAYRLLALGYEQAGRFQESLKAYHLYNELMSNEQQKLNQISEDAFRQQKEFAEQTLHYTGQEEKLNRIEQEHRKFQKIAFSLFLLSLALFLLVMRRGVLMQRQSDRIDQLSEDLFTHSRSKLKNLRMLNAKLSKSLLRTNENYEQWQMGELIHEPLNDRLRFVMIDLPFMRSMYVQNGYKAGLELERAFGAFLNTKIKDPARLYHFSDANLLYIEPNTERNYAPEAIFEKIQAWVDEFAEEHAINRTIRMGLADYPFLPRAYTAINDQELLDLLLLATHLAREVSLKDQNSHWIYLKAIENAPAASLAQENIRTACQHAIGQGLIKIHSSYKNEDDLKKILKSG